MCDSVFDGPVISFTLNIDFSHDCIASSCESQRILLSTTSTTTSDR